MSTGGYLDAEEHMLTRMICSDLHTSNVSLMLAHCACLRYELIWPAQIFMENGRVSDLIDFGVGIFRDGKVSMLRKTLSLSSAELGGVSFL